MMKTKIIEVREVTVDEEAKLIVEYISKNPDKQYVSELSETLDIELSYAFIPLLCDSKISCLRRNLRISCRKFP